MKNGFAIGLLTASLMACVSSANAQAWRNCTQNSIGPGGCESIAPGGGLSIGPGGGQSIGSGGGLSIGLRRSCAMSHTTDSGDSVQLFLTITPYDHEIAGLK
jgi:hypothetical protein